MKALVILITTGQIRQMTQNILNLRGTYICSYMLDWMYIIMSISSSVPDWDSDIAEDGELIYIKSKSNDDNLESSKAPLLENCETFKLRSDFKRSSTRRSKGM